MAGVSHSITGLVQPIVVPERVAERRAPHTSTCPSGFPHWFRIETPNGPTSEGVCKRCGEMRVFPNFTSDLGFDVQLDGTRFGGRS